MLDLKLLESAGVDVSRFIQAESPDFVWDTLLNSFQAPFSALFSKQSLKSYRVDKNVSDFSLLKNNNTLVVWYPTADPEILCCKTILDRSPILQKFPNPNRFVALNGNYSAFTWDFQQNYFNSNPLANALTFVLKQNDNLEEDLKDHSGIVVWNPFDLIYFKKLRYTKIHNYGTM